MLNSFYPKMAVTNIKKNAKMYLPYMLTCICTVMMFMLMNAISTTPGIDQLQGADSLRMVLQFGQSIIGIFAFIFLFYTNGFLLKRRKKELALYSILGLEKRHIGRILFFECVFTSVVSLVIGILGGVLFSKLMFLILMKLVQSDVEFKFVLNSSSIISTLILFGVIFLLTLISNLAAAGKSRPIELLYGGSKGEKEPKARWLIALTGAVCLGIGYYMAITVVSPLDALMQFFIAVILVMIGTYLLFITGSIAVLKILKKNKHFYYQPKHFTSVSGMIYRMKQNAVGLANICILSTGVLLSIATTVSLNIGIDGLISQMYPEDYNINSYSATPEDEERMKDTVYEEAKKAGLEIEEYIQYRYNAIGVSWRGDVLDVIVDDENGQVIPSVCMALTLDSYNQVMGAQARLERDEVLILDFEKDFGYPTIKINDKVYKVREELKNNEKIVNTTANMLDGFAIVFPSQETIENLLKESGKTEKSDLIPDLYIGYNVSGDEKQAAAFTDAVRDRYHKLLESDGSGELYIYLSDKASGAQVLRASISGFLFVGVFLGALFLMATVLIIYYKQISEGYEDKERFSIMQKVGMSKKEVRKSIRSQVLMIFFLPLIVAILHVGAAFNMINKLMYIFGLFDTGLFVICTLGTIVIFGVIYTVVFMLTAKTYYKIVG